MPGGVVTSAATAKMIEDVSERVLRGQAVPTRPGAWTIDHSTKAAAKRLARYTFGRNKRKIVISAAALVVAGVLTGGVAVGIAVAGRAAGFVAGRLYRRWERWKNEGKVTALFPDLLDESGQFRVRDFAIDASGGSSQSVANVIQAVKSLIQHRDFTKLTNSFADMVEAGQSFHSKYEAGRASVRSCAQGIEVLEAMFLFKYHFERLEPAVNFLDQYLLFILMKSQAMEAEFAQKVPAVLDRLMIEQTDPLAFLNTIANSSAVLHTHSVFSGDKDQKAWVLAALDPWARQRSLEGARTRMRAEATLGQDVRAAAEGAIPMTVVSSGTGAGVSQGVEQAIITSGTRVVDPSLAVSLSSGGGEAAVSILAEIANAQWNARQYRTRRTLGLTGMRDTTISEHVELMKSMLKSSLDRLTTKFEHWMVSHREFLEAADNRAPLTQVCTKMLRSRKHWAQSVGSEAYRMLGEFHQTVIGVANVENNKIFRDPERAALMERSILATSSPASATPSASTASASGSGSAPQANPSRADIIQGVIDTFVTTHMEGPCDGTYCYMPVKLLESRAGISVISFNPRDQEYPIFAIGSQKFVDLDD